MDHRSFGVTRVRFAVLDQKAGIADPESPGAATEFPCCFTPCDVICCQPLLLLPVTLFLCEDAADEFVFGRVGEESDGGRGGEVTPSLTTPNPPLPYFSFVFFIF